MSYKDLSSMAVILLRDNNNDIVYLMAKPITSEIRSPKQFGHHLAITSIDGRFRGRVEKYAEYFSEYATNKYRVFVEIEYLIAFLKTVGKQVNTTAQKKLRQIFNDFSLADTELIWKRDEEINHDAKAVEYFLQVKLTKIGLQQLINYLHFGLTTMDVDYTALAIILNKFNKEVFVPQVEKLISVISKEALEQKHLVMLGRSHGQIAVPTTAGKELANFAYRLQMQLKKFSALKMGAKITGAIGNFNALTAAYPEINWPKFSHTFLGKFGLESYPMTTQIEPFDFKIEYLESVKRINTIVSSLDQDIWRYLALGYLTLRDDKGHVGSSTMPQKINPIGFELSESYITLANGIFDVMERKLPVNRWQRDLTDKYLSRDIGQALVMSVLSYESTAETMERIGFNKGVIDRELDNHWECIAEGIQTILRTTTYTHPYEKLKELTRGKRVTKKDYEKFIDEIAVDKKIKDKLRTLSPWTYTGVADQLVEAYAK